MHVKKSYTVLQILAWTRRQSLYLLLLSLLPVVLWLIDMHLSMPWTPLAVIGTACAFILTFKNNAAYDRLREARNNWQNVEKDSKGLFLFINAFIVSNEKRDKEEAMKTMLSYYLAWLKAHTLQLRDPRDWEHDDGDSEMFRSVLQVKNSSHMGSAINTYLTPHEMERVMKSENRAYELIQMMNEYMTGLKEDEAIESLRMADASRFIIQLSAHQIENEKIKDTPFPRQYATIAKIFLNLFAILFPFGLTAEFAKLGVEALYISIPFSWMVNWVFAFLNMTADYSENPFEGLYNDVPITSISEKLEVDLFNLVFNENKKYPIREDNMLHVIV